ncbi:helix-turn-helix domain-containing protein [Changchengzhania lutea]|uniref:helix-turn-helix domain-containing protein n=1 Tax=Changchengzhania lutea TaxID=2049305 RepID=UPI00115D6EA8|nr:helix-turn-helix domain-containing protein [Changchengzhania lutea]
MANIQFIQVTPDELTEVIVKGVKHQLDELKKEFQPKQPTEYLTRNEVAKMLSIDLSTVHNWCKSKKLKPLGIGNRVYFRRVDVEAALVELK